jgi:signal transduction histidine kinase
MSERTPKSVQKELERLRKRVAELEHALEVQEWGVQLFHESNIPQLLLDFETGAILAANAAARQFYGESLMQCGNVRCLCTENTEWETKYQPLMKLQRYGIQICQQRTTHGARTVEVHYVLINLRGRGIAHTMSLDISEKIRYQRELEVSRARYHAFIHLSSDAIWREALHEPVPIQLPVEKQVDLIFKRAYLAECNKTFCRLWGTESQAGLLGSYLRNRVSPDDPRMRELVHRFIMEGYCLENWLCEGHMPDGEKYCRLCSFQGIIRDGSLWEVWGISRDITELVQMQRALQQSEERYRTFIEYANEGIWRFEVRQPIPIDLPIETQIQLIFEHSYLAECNKAFARMYGIEHPDAFLGIDLPKILIPTEPRNLDMLRSFIHNHYRVEGMVSKERAADGSERYFHNSFFGVIEDGCLTRAWGVQTDVTELFRLQQQLSQAYRMESIGKLAGGIAHDFNNVLTAVIGFAELARGRVQDETTLRYIDGIIQAAERAANLNRQLLAYARRQVVQLSPLNLDVWLQTTLDILRRVLPENIDLQTEVDPKLSAIQGDSDLLLQIVLNLVVNARDAMPNGGVIRITLQNKTLRRPHQTVPAGRYVALSVADTGSGIPSEVLLYIFEPFFSTKPVGQGTGMGLAAVHGAVQQLGSHIEVQTELGKGTCFTVYFPRLDPTRLPRQTSGTPAE